MIAWKALRGENAAGLPSVEWIEANCGDGSGFWAGLVLTCYAGLHWPGAIDVAYRPEQQLHTTALAHELLHERLLQTYGDGDKNHTRPEWTTDLLAANAALEAVGL